MSTTLSFSLKKAMPILTKDDRWNVLTAYIMHANIRNRAWPSLEMLSDLATNSNRTKACEAKKWLKKHGAIIAVPGSARMGTEKKLPPRLDVIELTGVIVPCGEPECDCGALDESVKYLYFAQPEIPEDETNSPDGETIDSPNDETINSPDGGTGSISYIGNPDSLVAAGDTGGAGAPERPHHLAAAAEGHYAHKAETPPTPPEPEIKTDVEYLNSHELVKLFREKCQHTGPLSRKITRKMTDDIKVVGEEGQPLQVYKGGLIAMWDQVKGFREFVEERLPVAFVACKGNSENVLAHLRNLNKAEGKLPGFLIWFKDNEQYFTEPEQPELKVTRFLIPAGWMENHS